MDNKSLSFRAAPKLVYVPKRMHTDFEEAVLELYFNGMAQEGPIPLVTDDILFQSNPKFMLAILLDFGGLEQFHKKTKDMTESEIVEFSGNLLKKFAEAGIPLQYELFQEDACKVLDHYNLCYSYELPPIGLGERIAVIRNMPIKSVW